MQVREGLLMMKLCMMSFHFQDCHTNRQANAGTGGFGNFFTGAALGALGGYAFGGRNRRWVRIFHWSLCVFMELALERTTNTCRTRATLVGSVVVVVAELRIHIDATHRQHRVAPIRALVRASLRLCHRTAEIRFHRFRWYHTSIEPHMNQANGNSVDRTHFTYSRLLILCIISALCFLFFGSCKPAVNLLFKNCPANDTSLFRCSPIIPREKTIWSVRTIFIAW